ncbi:MAG: hypothetical protein ACI906_000520 [Candidatus Latescibacterota bacterium]|jgi:hypothetical protein
MRGLWMVGIMLALAGCGRYFSQDLLPVAQQDPDMTVNDDGSVTYTLDRLAINLKPMTDAELNRQYPSASSGGAASVNPYTFGDWQTPGEDWTPSRFTVLQLKVSNYQYPKVVIDPLKATIFSTNNRVYKSMPYSQLYDYFLAFWQGRTGQGRADFKNRTSILRQSMYTETTTIFSGSEQDGYLVFPVLDDDVTSIQLHLEDIAVRFDYSGEPVETIDLNFSFEREVLRGYNLSDALQVNAAADSE